MFPADSERCSGLWTKEMFNKGLGRVRGQEWGQAEALSQLWTGVRGHSSLALGLQAVNPWSWAKPGFPGWLNGTNFPSLCALLRVFSWTSN